MAVAVVALGSLSAELVAPPAAFVTGAIFGFLIVLFGCHPRWWE